MEYPFSATTATQILGGLGHDMAVKVLPVGGSFFVGQGQAYLE